MRKTEGGGGRVEDRKELIKGKKRRRSTLK